MRVEVTNDHPQLRVDGRRIARQVRRVLQSQGRAGVGVDVTLVDDEAIAHLNKEYRDVDGVTDVLSFAIADDPEDPGILQHLGDVVVSLDTAKRQAATVRRETGSVAYKIRDETLFLVTHGTLHLLGFEHDTDEDAAVMERLELELMAGLVDVEPHCTDRSDHL